MVKAITLTLILIPYLYISFKTVAKIRNAIVFTQKQKYINIFLTFLVPIFWPVLIYFILKRETGSHENEVKTAPTTIKFYNTTHMGNIQ